MRAFMYTSNVVHVRSSDTSGFKNATPVTIRKQTILFVLVIRELSNSSWHLDIDYVRSFLGTSLSKTGLFLTVLFYLFVIAFVYLQVVRCMVTVVTKEIDVNSHFAAIN